jgi:hypothetical protein
MSGIAYMDKTGGLKSHRQPWLPKNCTKYSSVHHSRSSCCCCCCYLVQMGGDSIPHLTKLCLGVHEFNWDVSGLEGVAPQLVELELHNPFLK